MQMQMRVTLITGANKGIGKEIARRLGKEPNTDTILACRNQALAEATCKELLLYGCQNVVVCPLDLIDHDSIIAAANFVKEHYGKLDVLVNNAAICFNDPTLYGTVPHTPFEKQAAITVNTNFFGTLQVTQAMIPLLEKSASPRIINIASAAGRLSILKSRDMVETVTSPTLELDTLEGLMKGFINAVEDGTHAKKGYPNTCYGMSKLGIIALTKILSRQYPNILINSVDPGYCATDQNQNQGFVSAERGAKTPFLLATLPKEKLKQSGGHFFEEREIAW
jgi:carbonyl reductase 1